MSKPSDELLRRAREVCREYPMACHCDALMEFGEHIVRECAEKAADMIGCSSRKEIEVAVLRKFGLEP